MTVTATESTYKTITTQIVEALRSGVGEFSLPWTGGSGIPCNPFSSAPHYRGINILALWVAAHKKGYTSPKWATYKQWSEQGAQVRKGERSSLVVFWKAGNNTETDNEEMETQKSSSFVMARGYRVFNAEQVDGWSDPAMEPIEKEDDDKARAFFDQLPGKVIHGGLRACYHSQRDEISIPLFEQFYTTDSYYATLAHEYGHWTGHSSRLNRDLKNRFGSEAYAAEELIAELSSAFLCAAVGISPQPREDHACYIGNWIQVLENDERAVFTAASHAQKVADYLLNSTNSPSLS